MAGGGEVLARHEQKIFAMSVPLVRLVVDDQKPFLGPFLMISLE